MRSFRSAAPHRSRTRRADRQRETQIIIASLDARSSRRAPSRGGRRRPRRTSVSQVPQMPSRHEPSTLTPASWTTSKTDLSGGHLERHARALQHQLEGALLGRLLGLLGREPLEVQAAVRPRPAQRSSTAASSGSGRSSRRACPAAASPSIAARSSQPSSSSGRRAPGRRTPPARRGTPSTRGSGRRRAAPLGAGRLGLVIIGEQRRDADAAGDEPVARRATTGKWLRGPRTRTVAPGAQLVDGLGTAAAVGRLEHPDPPGVGLAGRPHREYWRVSRRRAAGRCARPGVQAGSAAPSGRDSVIATTSCATCSASRTTRSTSNSRTTVCVTVMEEPPA